MSYHTPFPRPVPMSSPVCAHVAITLRLADASDDLLVRHVRLLRDCVALAQQRWGFEVEAAVVLPGEVQMLCLFDDVKFGVGGGIKLICTAFARHVPGDGTGIWSDDSDVLEIAPPVAALRRAFIENAPVRAGLAKTAADWPYSSAHRAALQGSQLGAVVA